MAWRVSNRASSFGLFRTAICHPSPGLRRFIGFFFFLPCCLASPPCPYFTHSTTYSERFQMAGCSPPHRPRWWWPATILKSKIALLHAMRFPWIRYRPWSRHKSRPGRMSRSVSRPLPSPRWRRRRRMGMHHGRCEFVECRRCRRCRWYWCRRCWCWCWRDLGHLLRVVRRGTLMVDFVDSPTTCPADVFG